MAEEPRDAKTQSHKKIALPEKFLQTFQIPDGCYHRINRVVAIENQTLLPEMVYYQLWRFNMTDLELSLQEFKRVWRTLILKRVQDVYKEVTFAIPSDYIKLNRGILVPAPLSDILKALGTFRSQSTGAYYVATPPAHPADSPDWWILDRHALEGWVLIMTRMARYYLMRAFPSKTDVQGRSVLLTAIKDENAFRSVKSLTNEARPIDGYLRLVTDDLFEPDDHVVYENCHQTLVTGTCASTVIPLYVGSYCLQEYNC